MAGPAPKTRPTEPPRVAVVGLGVVSPLGFGPAETIETLRKGRDCVTPVSRFSVRDCRCQTAGQVSDDRLFEGDAGRLRRPARSHRVARMLISAFQQALAEIPGFQPELTVVGTTSGGMTFGEDYYRSLQSGRPDRRAPAWLANYLPQKAVIDAQEACMIDAPCQVIANACASGTNAVGHAFAAIHSGRYRQVLAGGYDALSELVFVGFDSLQAATPEKCRPFDRERSGMVIGEGAAILALEELTSARQRQAPILAEIVGYGISTDNYHLTQPNPSGAGPRQAMAAALRSANMENGTVDYINAHGTATTFNDAAEGKAIAELFGQTPVSSTKSLMGHSLGAAGAIEAVISILALQHQFLPPNIHFRTGDPDLELNIVANEGRPAQIQTVLSNSFGFGGTNASVIIQRAPQ